jgi:hypothetical protein
MLRRAHARAVPDAGWGWLPVAERAPDSRVGVLFREIASVFGVPIDERGVFDVAACFER